MMCSWSEFLAFIYVSTLGCLFGCFGSRGNPNRRRYSDLEANSSSATVNVVSRSRKRLNSLPISEEESDVSSCREKQYNLSVSPQQDFDFEGLKHQAEFLKICGTIPETPAEIRKASIISNSSSPNGDLVTSKYHSWLPNTSIQKLDMEMPPSTLDRQCEARVSGCDSSPHEPSSCIRSGQIPLRTSTSTEDSDDTNFGMDTHVYTNRTASVQSRNKSVRFSCQSDASLCSSNSSSSEDYGQSSTSGDETLSKTSPYPTPLKLTDDMQTPGTVFASYIGNMVVGKNPKIRTQYVHSVGNPVQNIQRRQVLMEEESDPDKLSGKVIKSLEQTNCATSSSEVGILDDTVEDEMKGEASLSSWLKPLPPNQGANNQLVITFVDENTYFGITPGDRPILGTVAANWNDDEPSSISPKLWDGNGIPNSITKYKEDQKVSWHTTPFEERLEKALSEKTVISQRRKVERSPLLDFNDNEISC